jgi:hypothetical protein
MQDRVVGWSLLTIPPYKAWCDGCDTKLSERSDYLFGSSSTARPENLNGLLYRNAGDHCYTRLAAEVRVFGLLQVTNHWRTLLLSAARAIRYHGVWA